MTDARFPERWLNDRRVLRLSDAGFRLFVVSLTYSVSNRTDGRIDDDDLDLMPKVDAGRVDELVKIGLWEQDGDHYVITVFADTQTPRAQLDALDHRRQLDRDRSKRYRDRKSRDSSRDDKGQDRLGQDRLGQALEEGDEEQNVRHLETPASAVAGADSLSDPSRYPSRDDVRGQLRAVPARELTCDQCGDSPTHYDGTGGRFCSVCKPHLWWSA